MAEKKKNKAPQGKPEKKKEKGELSIDDLAKVSGGTGSQPSSGRGFNKPGDQHHHEDP